jgi:hypothetical protein
LTRAWREVWSATMNDILRSLAAAVLAGLVASADAPEPTRVVVLDNDNLLEGHVRRVDDGDEVRRSVGGDVTFPASRVVAVVADRKAAYTVVAGRANRRDADERLRLAKWCVTHGLDAEALAEAEAAARMRPGFKAAERLAESLRATVKAVPTGPDTAIAPTKAESPPKDTVKDVPAIEYNSESFPLFAGKVNTILMNTCASCHAKDDIKAFRLTRAGGRAGVTKNLMSALAQVNPADPTASPLLVKAVSPHGNATEAPLKTRTHPAYQALETWARIARAADGTPAPLPGEPRKLPDLGPETPASGELPGKDSKALPAKPAKAQGDDPFDPAIFNGDARKK